MAEQEEGRRGQGPARATSNVGKEELESLRCVMAPTTTGSAWVPGALVMLRSMSGWQKMTMGIMGPNQIKYPRG